MNADQRLDIMLKSSDHAANDSTASWSDFCHYYDDMIFLYPLPIKQQ